MECIGAGRHPGQLVAVTCVSAASPPLAFEGREGTLGVRPRLPSPAGVGRRTAPNARPAYGLARALSNGCERGVVARAPRPRCNRRGCDGQLGERAAEVVLPVE